MQRVYPGVISFPPKLQPQPRIIARLVTIYLNVDYVFYDTLDRLRHGMPGHPHAIVPLSLALNTHDDASSRG